MLSVGVNVIETTSVPPELIVVVTEAVPKRTDPAGVDEPLTPVIPAVGLPQTSISTLPPKGSEVVAPE